MSETGPPRGRFSSTLIIMVIVALALSIAAFFFAADAYGNQDPIQGSYFMMIGIMGLTLLTYLMFQTRRKTLRMPIQLPRVATTILCQKCGFKNIREFQRGDYILKEGEECPKCNEQMIIASIYREVKEKKGEKELS
ncbi:MAG: hypothetical protein OEX76_04430 [Candidatus Bathyarchaeota archaeon]|nr:hypothetical protein [Candidatus Bathyarchaeota archaeon]MDH5712982.1 hypothetical protein [Candidatus Bathyarchaeota archaeon]